MRKSARTEHRRSMSAFMVRLAHHERGFLYAYLIAALIAQRQSSFLFLNTRLNTIFLFIMKKLTLYLFVVLMVAIIGGCSANKLAVNAIANALSGDGGTVFAGDDDPELIGDALPFALKMYESLLEQTPGNQKLLVATGKSFIMYGYAFVQQPAEMLPEEQMAQQRTEKQRAKKLFLRAREYLFSALIIAHPEFKTALKSGSIDSALAHMTPADTTALYWAGMAWMAAITIDKEDIGLMVTMSQAVACINRAAALNPTFGDGALDEFYLTYFGSLPASMGGSEEKARACFARAIQRSHGAKAGPYVALATSVCVKTQNSAEFKELLNKALLIDVSQKDKNRLTNIITQRKARWLLDHIDNYFVE